MDMYATLLLAIKNDVVHFCRRKHLEHSIFETVSDHRSYYAAISEEKV